MRRSVAIALSAVFIAVAVAAVALAATSGGGSGGDSAGKATAGGWGVAAHERRHGERRHGGRRHGRAGFPFFAPLRAAFNGFAERLDVTPRELKQAFRGVKDRALQRAVEDGTITAEERDALGACMGRKRRGGSCDQAAARRAHRKLHRSLHAKARDLAALKDQLFSDLAAELDRPVAQVEQAARAELVELLDKAVERGFLSDRGRTLALECFDTPNECKRRELRGELRFPFGGRHHGGRRP